jgi:Ca2+-binding EF-hand superfamily protein
MEQRTMTNKKTLGNMAAAWAASGLLAASAPAQAPPANPPRTLPAASAPAPGQPVQATPGQITNTGQAAQIEKKIEQIPTPLDSPKDFRDLARLGFMAADANRDGQISKDEATVVGNMAVGGLFFAADVDGDGTVTQEEARAVRERILQQQPALRILVQRAKQVQQTQGTGGQPNPFQGVADLLDGNNDKQLQAAEVRTAVQTAIEGLYAIGDTNRDNQMSPDEVNAAAIAVAQAAGDAVFQLADTDNNGQVSQEEFHKAIVEPANAVFAVVDLNGDGQISADEARQARAVLMSQLMPNIPQPAGNAPVPTIRVQPAATGGQGNE